MEKRKSLRWTEEENKLLCSQVRAFPQNLSRCFIMVAEQTGRSVSAVSQHWYEYLSKMPYAEYDSSARKKVSKEEEEGNTLNFFRRLHKAINYIMGRCEL